MQAVVFDFDGVIARSMEQHAEAYRRVLAPYGIEVTDHDVFMQEGARSETILREFLRRDDQEHGDDVVRRLADEKQQVFRSLGTPELYPGARALVKAVHDATDDTALVTGTRRENLDKMVPDLLPLFRAVLAQDAYTRDKPDPEPYAKAADALGKDPARCIALENALRGVESARRAGYGAVIAIATTLDASDFDGSGADVVVDDHEAMLAETLQRLDKA